MKGDRVMKGYFTGEGYMGFIDGEYILFVSESEYRDCLESGEAEQ